MQVFVQEMVGPPLHALKPQRLVQSQQYPQQQSVCVEQMSYGSLQVGQDPLVSQLPFLSQSE